MPPAKRLLSTSARAAAAVLSLMVGLRVMLTTLDKSVDIDGRFGGAAAAGKGSSGLALK